MANRRYSDEELISFSAGDGVDGALPIPDDFADNITTQDMGRVLHSYGYTLAHRLASSGKLNRVNPDILTVGILASRSKPGLTPFGSLAHRGEIKAIPERLMTEELCVALDSEFDNALHSAGHGKCLSDVPSEWITRERLLKVDAGGGRAIDFIAVGGELGVIPGNVRSADILTIKPKNGRPALHHAVQAGGYQEAVLWGIKPDDLDICANDGSTTVHAAVLGGRLGDIPEEHLTDARMSARNDADETPFHVAARLGKLKDVPAELLKPEWLSLRNGDGFSVYDLSRERRKEMEKLIGIRRRTEPGSLADITETDPRRRGLNLTAALELQNLPGQDILVDEHIVYQTKREPGRDLDGKVSAPIVPEEKPKGVAPGLD